MKFKTKNTGERPASLSSNGGLKCVGGTNERSRKRLNGTDHPCSTSTHTRGYAQIPVVTDPLRLSGTRQSPLGDREGVGNAVNYQFDLSTATEPADSPSVTNKSPRDRPRVMADRVSCGTHRGQHQTLHHPVTFLHFYVTRLPQDYTGRKFNYCRARRMV